MKDYTKLIDEMVEQFGIEYDLYMDDEERSELRSKIEFAVKQIEYSHAMLN